MDSVNVDLRKKGQSCEVICKTGLCGRNLSDGVFQNNVTFHNNHP